jgi:hypothetical protein
VYAHARLTYSHEYVSSHDPKVVELLAGAAAGAAGALEAAGAAGLLASEEAGAAGESVLSDLPSPEAAAGLAEE